MGYIVLWLVQVESVRLVADGHTPARPQHILFNCSQQLVIYSMGKLGERSVHINRRLATHNIRTPCWDDGANGMHVQHYKAKPRKTAVTNTNQNQKLFQQAESDMILAGIYIESAFVVSATHLQAETS